jgi:hypothetical protein
MVITYERNSGRFEFEESRAFWRTGEGVLTDEEQETLARSLACNTKSLSIQTVISAV